jgi:hypothetical protein
MNRYILDTDHLTLLKSNHPIARTKIGSVFPAELHYIINSIEPKEIQSRFPTSSISRESIVAVPIAICS